MSKEPIDWEGNWTLEDYIISLFEAKQTESVEFKALLRVFGREKIKAIWERFKQRKGEIK